MGDGMLSLSWNNHSTTFCHMLSNLRQKERYTDATVACEGKFYPVHQLVLSTCSQYFEEMFEHTTGKHPVVLLHDVRRYELEALLSYMYAGIVSVAQRDLARLIKVAELLQIKGLAVPDELPGDKKTVINSHNTNRDSLSPKSKLIRGTESSDDRSSPHPKRRKREESGSSPHLRQAPPHTPDSPTTPHDVNHENSKISYSSQDQDLEELDKSGETNLLDESINEDQKQINRSQEARTAQQRVEHQVNDRYLHQSVSQDTSRNQYRVKDGGEDAIVIKEEAWEDAGEHQREESEADYMSEDTAPRPCEAGQEDPTSLLLAKEYEGQVHQLPPALPEVVVEALAGPSGMHQWLGGAEFGSGGTDSYGGDGGSPPPADASHLQQMGERLREGEGGLDGAKFAAANRECHTCPICGYTTLKRDHLKEHQRTHTGEKPYCCPYCPHRTAKSSNLARHLRSHITTHYTCPRCPFLTTSHTAFKKHTCPQGSLLRPPSKIESELSQILFRQGLN